jgi:pimeloyl-ACP methyl ester carboxylesterase
MTRAATAVLVGLLAALTLVAFHQQPPSDRIVPSADGVSISYHIEGRGSPALMFVHGWSCDKTYWNAQIPVFAKAHTVVSLDLAGHGLSRRDRREWSIQAFGSDVAAVIHKEKLDGVILIGHSMGGDVIVEAARLSPEKILGFIGVDTFHDLAAAASSGEADEFLAAFKADYPQAAGDYIRSMFLPGTDEAFIEKIVKAMTAEPPSIGVAAFKATMMYSPAETLKRIRLPIIAINSSMFATRSEANKVLAASFDLKILAGAGHFPMMENPGEFNRLLEDSIREMTAGK